ncbi:hypothetical protein [Pseudoclavibacter sp. 13-3]|uniref:hypothetical protein n=1 Tax=Pseudoclavibacter sp. 13-3 TaxID=2901228 RepID=UPI001E5B4E81|nr:hypothetical protein [Pseudoclavibacter sp. 13-3]MCD7100468.1 hypothetical protein [Pseudoclavibacter sp. 13-3]
MTALTWKPVTAPDWHVVGWIARDFSAPGMWRRKDHNGRHLGPIVRGGRPTAARTLLERVRAEYERLTAPVDDNRLRAALAALAGHEEKGKADD